MMHGTEKSDSVIVARKPANKAQQSTVASIAVERSAAEPVERRAGTKGNAGQQSTCRTQRRISVSQALERIRKAARCQRRSKNASAGQSKNTSVMPVKRPRKLGSFVRASGLDRIIYRRIRARTV